MGDATVTAYGGACTMDGMLYAYGGTIPQARYLNSKWTNQLLASNLNATFINGAHPSTNIVHDQGAVDPTYPPNLPEFAMSCLETTGRFLTAGNYYTTGKPGQFLWSYDVNLAKWTEAPPLTGFTSMAASNYTRSFPGMSIEPMDQSLSKFGGLTYILGGSTTAQFLNTLDIFDATTNSWKLHLGNQTLNPGVQNKIPALISPQMVFVSHLNATLVLGGCTTRDTNGSVIGCATYDTAYLIPSGSGSNATGPDDSITAAAVAASIQVQTLRPASSLTGLPIPRWDSCFTLMLKDTTKSFDAQSNPYSRLFLHGGGAIPGNTKTLSDMWILDLDTWTWSPQPVPYSTPSYTVPVFTRAGHSCHMLRDDVLMMFMGVGTYPTSDYSDPPIPNPAAFIKISTWTFSANFTQPAGSSNNNGGSSGGSNLDTGALAGIIAGAVVLLAGLGLWLYKRQRKPAKLVDSKIPSLHVKVHTSAPIIPARPAQLIQHQHHPGAGSSALIIHQLPEPAIPPLPPLPNLPVEHYHQQSFFPLQQQQQQPRMPEPEPTLSSTLSPPTPALFFSPATSHTDSIGSASTPATTFTSPYLYHSQQQIDSVYTPPTVKDPRPVSSTPVVGPTPVGMPPSSTAASRLSTLNEKQSYVLPESSSQQQLLRGPQSSRPEQHPQVMDKELMERQLIGCEQEEQLFQQQQLQEQSSDTPMSTAFNRVSHHPSLLVRHPQQQHPDLVVEPRRSQHPQDRGDS